MSARAGSEQVLSADLVARALCKLDLTSELTLDGEEAEPGEVA